MRRFFVLLLVVGLLFVVASPAVAGPKGELTSGFHTEGNDFRDGILDRPEGHVTPLTGPGPVPVCADQVVGTWFTVTEFTKEDLESFLEAITIEIWLDGVQLDTVRTPIKKHQVIDEAFGPDFDVFYAFTEGVPVIGTLDEGTHLLEYVIIEAGYPDWVLGADLVVSPANC